MARAVVIETRNRAEPLTYVAVRVLSDNKDNTPEADATEVRAKVDAVRTALKGKDDGAVKGAVADLTAALHKVATRMYESASKTDGAPPSSEGSPSQEPGTPRGGESGPVDADFKVVDKEPGEEKGA